MVTPQGQVKIMDFGLARLAERSKITKTSTLIGTPAYMSPEQAQRLPADSRTDVWSLGVVIYEMVTGRLPFEGERQEAVLYAIGNEEPEPITALRAGLPMELEWIVGKTLAKDPDQRYQHIDETAVDLRSLTTKLATGKSTTLAPGIKDTSLGAQTTTTPGTMPQGSRKHGAAWALLAAVLAFALFASLYFRPTLTVERPVRKWSFAPDDLVSYGSVVVSPNGRHIAYRAGTNEPAIWVRDMDSVEPRRLPGTESRFSSLFWSPDSEWIGFWAGGELKRISRSGGLPIVVCRTTRGATGSWSPDGETIILATGRQLFEVPARGGTPKPLPLNLNTERGPIVSHPRFLPQEASARAVLYAVGVYTTTEIWVANLETGNARKLVEGAEPYYSRSGHIIYRTSPLEPGLWALPFSLETLEATDGQFPIDGGLGLASVSTDGTLVAVDLPRAEHQRLVLLDRRGGKMEALGAVQRRIVRPSVSPSGTRVAVEGLEHSSDAGDIWIHEVSREIKQRLTVDDTRDTFPSWSPDGLRIVYRSDREGQRDLWVTRPDGQGEPTRLTNTAAGEYMSDWAPDGRLIYVATDGESLNLRLLTLDPEGRVQEDAPFLATPFDESYPQVSPNGKYIAYVSDESGEREVYVREFPQGSNRRRVSENGGTSPRWSRDGSELFYVEENSLMAASISTDATFAVTSVNRLFDHSSNVTPGTISYDVFPDGRFVVVEDLNSEGEVSKPTIHVTENWYEEFRDRELD